MKILKFGNSIKASKRCVISLGIGKNAFTNSLVRLGESLKRVQFDGDFLFWDEEFPEGCPSHFDAPFAFKAYCFYAASRLGYTQILWMDSTCVAIRPLSPIFESINQNGYVLFNNNYDQSLGQWISDEALAFNQLSREDAMTIPEIPCSVIGLDLSSDIASGFLSQWHQIMSDGVTAKGTTSEIQDWAEYQEIFWNRNNRISQDPRVKGHRCDQPAAGIVAHRLGMLPYSDYLKDIHYQAKPVKRNTIILHHREFGESITPLSDIYYRLFFKVPFVDRPRSYLRKLAGIARGLGNRTSR
jgi:hypothetical protein